VLAEHGDPVWRTITSAARAKFRGSKVDEESASNDQAMMEPQALSIPMMQQAQHQSIMSSLMGEARGTIAHNPVVANTPSNPHSHHEADLNIHPNGQGSEQDHVGAEHLHHMQAMPMTVTQLYTPQPVAGMQVRLDAFAEQANALRHRLNLPSSVPDEVVERFHTLSSDCAEALRAKARVEADNRQLINELQMRTQELEHYKQLSTGLSSQGMGNPGAAPSS
jgi:hypothetical protein